MKLFTRPFKGTYAWEWQIGPVVLQWIHTRCIHTGKGPHVWIDPFWIKGKK